MIWEGRCRSTYPHYNSTQHKQVVTLVGLVAQGQMGRLPLGYPTVHSHWMSGPVRAAVGWAGTTVMELQPVGRWQSALQ